MEIIVNKNGIEKVGNRIIELSSEYDERIKKINSLIEKIQLCWTGQDADSFVEIMISKFIPALLKTRDSIENYGNYLKQIPNTYSKVDEQYSNNIK